MDLTYRTTVTMLTARAVRKMSRPIAGMEMTDVVALSMSPSVDLSTKVDRVEPIRKLRRASPRRNAGVGGVNVACVIGRFEANVTAIYPTGGTTIQLLRWLVDQEGSEPDDPVNGQTREDFTVVEKKTGTGFRFVFPGPRLTKHEWRMYLTCQSGPCSSTSLS